MAPERDAPLLVSLLSWVGSGRTFRLGRSISGDEIDWVVRSALGPILHAAARDEPGLLPAADALRLKAADLAARVVHGEQRDALAEIVDACAGRISPVTLLKGSALCGVLYPEAHWRLMGDLDLLVDADESAALDAILEEMGYERDPRDDVPPDHHHAPARVHPQTRVSIEVHTGLFPPASGLTARPPFDRGCVSAERRDATLAGHAVRRLGPELQLLHAASHWAFDLRPAAAARALLDGRLLLRRPLDWERVRGWCASRRVAAHLQLLLSTLRAHGLAALPELLRADWERHPPLDRISLAWLRRAVDRHLLGGVPPPSEHRLQAPWDALLNSGEPHAWNWLRIPWRLAFPRRPDRFQPSFQWSRLRRGPRSGRPG